MKEKITEGEKMQYIVLMENELKRQVGKDGMTFYTEAVKTIEREQNKPISLESRGYLISYTVMLARMEKAFHAGDGAAGLNEMIKFTQVTLGYLNVAEESIAFKVTAENAAKKSN